MKKSTACLLLLFVMLMNYSCSTVTYKTIFPTLDDGKYDSEFPYKGSSAELEEIGQSVYRINSTAFYYTYIFDTESKLRMSEVTEDVLKNRAIKTALYDQTAAGTATLISTENSSVALLTCSHVVDFPDTIIGYKHTADGKVTQFVESISIKDKQTTYIAGFPGGGELQVILSDRNLDLAIIGNRYSPDFVTRLKTLKFPYGTAKTLEWGTFVYLFGYPLSYKMITKAIVSSPNYDEHGSFLIDAIINRGFSGGIVLAIKDGVPNFELVGMVQRVPKEDEDYLRPEALSSDGRYSPLIPYEGEIYADKRINIRYGIAKIISIEQILEYIEKHRDYLNQKGYFINILR
ncbi:MAG: trypsin-like peptidase domain-containing protein [Ignavibacteriales bacterium]|nr:MAG: trypsin-like peptidase domain-containing protein [Ignavibacteriales bacterium]